MAGCAQRRRRAADAVPPDDRLHRADHLRPDLCPGGAAGAVRRRCRSLLRGTDPGAAAQPWPQPRPGRAIGGARAAAAAGRTAHGPACRSEHPAPRPRRCAHRGAPRAGQPHRPEQGPQHGVRRCQWRAARRPAAAAPHGADPAGDVRPALRPVRRLPDALAVLLLRPGRQRDDRQRAGAVHRQAPAQVSGGGQGGGLRPSPGGGAQCRGGRRPGAGLHRPVLGQPPVAGRAGPARRLGAAPVLRALGAEPGTRLVPPAPAGLARTDRRCGAAVPGAATAQCADPAAALGR